MNVMQNSQLNCDVLVIGAGLAGCMAALSAAEQGAQVVLASKAGAFSGCSFYGGTWGLGLIGPADAADETDLEQTILEIGCGVANPDIVHAFVTGIRPAIAKLESYGVELVRPTRGAEREYIACFDKKVRAWHGIRREAFIDAIGPRLKEAGVRVVDGVELMQIVQDEQGRVVGAVVHESDQGRFSRIACKALVMATGGMATLFGRRLAPADCLATGQAIAMECGADTVNLEFMQLMPGLVDPVRGVVFNEKAFRFCDVEGLNDEEALDARSYYGPFTCRLIGNRIDVAIGKAGEEGLGVRLNVDRDLPEFVTVFYDWLRKDFGLLPDEPVRIAHYAHAANGGIAIDSSGMTSVPGLFAAGEATGGMHGADRMGGLSSANCLVFGMASGKAAAEYAAQSKTQCQAVVVNADWARCAYSEVDDACLQLNRIMDASCMAFRTSDGLAQAKRKLEDLSRCVDEGAKASDDAAAIAATRRLALRIRSAQAMVEAALNRVESVGSHYRAD